MRVGFGYDSHRLVEGRPLILGGIEVPHHKGLKGHSDGDALTHSIIDAILGALGKGDIGAHFPDTDPQFEGISSLVLLGRTLALCEAEGLKVAWCDSTIILERPKLAPYIGAMKEALEGAGLVAGTVSIKAKTNEGMGLTGRGEGAAAMAVCLLQEI